MSNEDTNLESWRTTLRREEQAYARQYEAIVHSDRAAVDIGLNAIKLLTIISAGSIVALLALVGQFWEKDRTTAQAILSEAGSFVWAIIFALSCAFIAYLYQSCVTAGEWRRLYHVARASTVPHRFRIADKAAPWLCLIMLATGFASFGLIVHGVVSVQDRLTHAKPPESTPPSSAPTPSK